MSIELKGVLNVDCGKGVMFAVELHRVHADLVEHMMLRGFKPCLSDVHAGITLAECDGDEAKQRELSFAAVTKYVEACYAGTARVRGETRVKAATDPVTAEAEREARVTIQALAKKLGAQWYAAVGAALGLPFETEKDKQALRDAAIAKRAAKPENVETARKIVEARKEIKVNLDDLGL